VRAPDHTLSLAGDVLAYWRALGPQRWFVKDTAVDAEIRHEFQEVHRAAVAGSLGHWEDDASGALALIIVLDQFPRNMFRGTAAALAADPLARAAAGRAIERGFDRQATEAERPFFYLPYTTRKRLPTSSAAASCAGPPQTRAPSNTPSFTPILFAASAASRTATPCLAGSPRPRSRRFLIAAALRDEGHTGESRIN
jgi:uncharacterized protein (DUF924 family)